MPGGMVTNIGDAFATGINIECYELLRMTMAVGPENSELTDMADLVLFGARMR